MSENGQKVRNPIENVLLFLGVVFSGLGIYTLIIGVLMLGWILDSWLFVTSGSIFLSIGMSLLYLSNNLTQLKLE